MRTPGRARGRLLLVAVVATATLAVVALTRPPSAAGPSASPGPSDDAPAGLVGGPWGAISWQLVPVPFPPADPVASRIDGLVASDDLAVAWGRVAAPGRNQFNDFAGIFVSADGRGWRSIAITDGVAPPDTSELGGVAAGPDGWLARGGVCCTAQEEPAIWTSRDGLAWTRQALGGDLDETSRFAQVIGTADGWVAVGASGGRAAIWTSEDGATWEAVDAEAAELGQGDLSDVTRLDGGRLVAVGTVDDAAGTHDGGVWVTDDGTAWRRVAADDPALIGPDETELSRVRAFRGGLFLVGNFGSHEDRVECEQLLGAMASLEARPPQARTALSCGWGREHHWLSDDGEGWVRLPPLDQLPGVPPDPRLRPLEFRLVVAAGDGLVNLAEDTQQPEGDSAVWASKDGSTWRLVDIFGPVRPNAGTAGFAVVGETVMAIGDSGEAGGWKPAIWTGVVGAP